MITARRSPMHVVAAAVTASDGRVLIAQRPPGKHLAGWWEFPGGKVEAGESPVDALARELHEELAIELSGAPRPLRRLRHTYPHGDVLLDMWVVTRYDGDPRGMDGQAIQWCAQDDLEANTEMLPADRPLVRALRLPQELGQANTQYYEVHWRVPGGAAPVGQDDMDKLQGVFCEHVDDALSARATGHVRGADFLVMCERLEPDQLQSVCRGIDLPVYACGIPVETAIALGATGVSKLRPKS